MNSLLLSMRVRPSLLRRRDRHGRTTCSSAIATACARRMQVESGSQRRIFAGRTPSDCISRPSWTLFTAIRRPTSRHRYAIPARLLSWTKRLLAVRKTSQAFGRGARRFLKPGIARSWPTCVNTAMTPFCACNLSRSAQPGGTQSGFGSRPGSRRNAWANHVSRRSATCRIC